MRMRNVTVSNIKSAFLTIELVVLALSPMAFAQPTAKPAQTGNAVNGINSYPGPSAIKYAPERDPESRRIDSFFGDWHESEPRHIHGSLVVRDVLTKGDNFAPPFRAAFLQYANTLSYATLAAHASTTPSRLMDQQEVYYVTAGAGTITASGVTAQIRANVAVFMPANLEFVMQNTGDQPLHMYIINEPTPPHFKPVDKMAVVDERTAHVRTPSTVAHYATALGIKEDPGAAKPDSYIVPGASGHWSHVVRELFSAKDGLGTLSSVITVELPALSLGEPHPHAPGHEEIWLALEGDSLAMLGSQLRMQRPGTAYMARPDGAMVHSNINFGDRPVKFLYFVNGSPKAVKP
jgi:mannose-6-phosphate isomerase-like protein (cupin superfamily)